MALKVEKGVLTSPGATGNQTINLIDTGFGTVKALVLWTAYETAEGDTGADAIWSHGFGSYRGGTPQQWCIHHFDDDAAATIATAGGSSSASILRGVNSPAAALDFDVALVSLGDASFVLNWTDLPTTSSIKVHYLALGGSEITDAYVKKYALTAGTGVEDLIVLAGFGQPDLLLAAGSGTDAEGDVTFGTPVMFGVGKNDTNQGVTSYAVQDNTSSVEAASFQENDFICMFGADTAIDVNAVLSAKADWPTDGFRINKLTNYAANSAQIGILALKGTFTAVIGSNTAPTAAPTVTQDLEVGATPRGAIFFHNVLPVTAGQNNSDADLGTFGLGATDGTREGWAGVGDNDAAAAAEARRHHSESKAIKMITPAAAGTLTSEADSSFVGTAVRLTWADTDTVAREYRYLLLGDAPSGAITINLGIASETDTALAMVLSKPILVNLGIPAETDSPLALSIVAPKSILLGLASEADTALAITLDTGAPVVAVRTGGSIVIGRF